MKTDLELGLQVQNYLKEKGVETPLKANQYKEHEKLSIIEEKFKDIMNALGLDLADDSLTETPRRVAKMYVNEIFTGLNYENFPKCTTVENKMNYDEMVIVNNITSISNCEHHFVVIDGLCKVAYIPKQKILGLSKINRIVQFFSQRPQIQERLTEQIYFALSYILETEDIAVELKAVHYCVKSRGVSDTNSFTETRKLGGKFLNIPEVRTEFLSK